MGSTPTQKIEADLNGNGTLVDLTASISAWQVNLNYPNGVVDMRAGVKHFRGRTDWTQADQLPGTLTFTVDNSSGRFTPGAGSNGYTVGLGGVPDLNSWASYGRGFRPGVLVKWTCNGTRVRHFRMGVPQLSFTKGVATTTVTCYDALGDLARQSLSSMMVEEIKARRPIVYYPLTDTKVASGTTVALDQSGRSQPPLTPYGWSADTQLAWSNAQGPPADGTSSLTFRKDDTTTSLSTPGATAGLRVEPYAQPAATINYLTGSNSPQHLAWAVSFWLSYKDIYGAPSGTAGLTDGPYVGLLRIRGSFFPVNSGSTLDLVLRIKDRRLLLRCPDGTMAKVSTDSYSLSPTDLHHVVITFRQQQSSPYNLTTQGWIDGVALTSNATATSAAYLVPNDLPVEITPFASPYAGPSSDLVYALSGSISHLSVHGPPDVTLTSTTSTVPASFLAAGGLSFAESAWRAGKLTLTESVTNRVARLASYSRAAATIDTAGTDSGLTVGTQATSNKSLLSALGSALRADDSVLLAQTVSGTEKVTARLTSLHRSSTPALTIDVADDCDGEPDLIFDTSGSATKVTATGAAGVSAVFVDSAALDLASDRSIESALAVQSDLLGLAQQRAAMGRIDRLSISEITVNASSSKASLTAALLDLQPGQTVRVTGLPLWRLTYVASGPTSGATASAVTVVVTGVEETHTLTGSRFKLTVQPWKGEGYVADADLRLVGSHSSTGAANDLMIESGMTAGQTTLVVRTPNSTSISTAAADYPCYFGFTGQLPYEIIYCPNPPGAATASGTAGFVQQTFTGVTRGALGSTATTHSAGETVEFIEGATSEFLPMPYVGF